MEYLMSRPFDDSRVPRRFSLEGRDPRKWQQVKNLKLRRDPICQIRVKCQGAAASEVSYVTPVSGGGSPYDPDNLRSACRACQQWTIRTASLRVHP
jgi:5-methylcytosine-specific restriction endonuclease McrA